MRVRIGCCLASIAECALLGNKKRLERDVWRYCLSPLRFAQGLARRAQRSFALLRMTARTPLKFAHGKPYLQRSRPEMEFQRWAVGKLVVHADLSEHGSEIDDCPMRSDL